jgi:hypothetical protein
MMLGTVATGATRFARSELMISHLRPAALAVFVRATRLPVTHAQDNYEIQVYGSETQAPRTTMFELHSNFSIEGNKTVIDGMLPTEHAVHERAEITTPPLNR